MPATPSKPPYPSSNSYCTNSLQHVQLASCNGYANVTCQLAFPSFPQSWSPSTQSLTTFFMLCFPCTMVCLTDQKGKPITSKHSPYRLSSLHGRTCCSQLFLATYYNAPTAPPTGPINHAATDLQLQLPYGQKTACLLGILW